jgi:hypothetical protein
MLSTFEKPTNGRLTIQENGSFVIPSILPGEKAIRLRFCGCMVARARGRVQFCEHLSRLLAFAFGVLLTKRSGLN